MSKINDFIYFVEAINDDELTVPEMRDAYANSEGYVNDDLLGRLELASEKLMEALIEIRKIREAQ